ncbi:tetratricopeptide repeat protein [Sphingobium phenoxybenzoativorans]|uniref:Tetratricopeptide repeat protein n=1 Tax=Sphingobium phenoxybenzoativorans TaxID=1592790 RepID=A0A975Q3C9_9SPHN|nr:tetratricopeptide repeat protein [Sphingobium phenoxybenzoativorans]QUT07348.1 tetratricopeptide repeat protein [Sphingobium phenoxybenzoativorans]
MPAGQTEISALLARAAETAQGPTPGAARTILDALFAKAPGHPDGFTVLGIVEQRCGHNEAACDAFARAVAADPNAPAKLANYGAALKNTGRLDEAITVLERAVAIQPDAPGARNNLGSALLAADRPDEAIPHLRHAVAIRTAYPEAWNNLGVAFSRMARNDEAIRAYDIALTHRPGYAEAGVSRALALEAAGDPAAALNQLDQTLASRPTHWPAFANKALLLEKLGRHDEAAASHRQAIILAPDQQMLYVNFATMLLKAGDPQAALTICEDAGRRPNPGTSALALRTLALGQLDRQAERDHLLGIDRFVRILDHETAPGGGDLAPFGRALCNALRHHASLTFEPEGLVTRAGHQSSELAGESGPLGQLAQMARTAVITYMADLPAGDHPFIAAQPKEWTITLWGTALQPGGEVGPHIHAPNWLSGVYYPDEDAVNPAEAPAGWFEIGKAPDGLGPSEGLHRIAPAAGRMILFPSYYYHRTLPFGGTRPRISFAFDVVPAGHGRPHRLAVGKA